jgi:Cu-processing system ATP-binding protein
MKLALGLIRPSAGAVRAFGANPATSKTRHRGHLTGFLPESITFHEAMTGREMLAFYARLKGEPVSRNGELLERVGLAEAADNRIKTYSKGMRQRLGLAQALLGPPQLVLLDEPTTGLDPLFRQSFYALLQELTQRGSSAVLSSHALSELETRIDRVVILQAGRLIAHGSLAELAARARLKAKIRIATAAGAAATLAHALDPDGMVTWVNDRAFELSCPLEEKLALLRRIGGLEIPVEDIEVTSPALDEVFAHFTSIEAG